MTHNFRVIRLWEEAVEVFLSIQGLLPCNLTAVTSILAGLELEEQEIRRLMRSPLMRESTMYQSILSEGRAEGGAIEGRALVLK